MHGMEQGGYSDPSMKVAAQYDRPMAAPADEAEAHAQALESMANDARERIDHLERELHVQRQLLAAYEGGVRGILQVREGQVADKIVGAGVGA